VRSIGASTALFISSGQIKIRSGSCVGCTCALFCGLAWGRHGTRASQKVVDGRRDQQRVSVSNCNYSGENTNMCESNRTAALGG
jgi:hypothetical protein